MKLITSLSKRRYLAIISVLLIIAALIALAAGCEGEGEGDGDGSTHPSEDLEIRTWYDLDAVRHNLGGNHTLMNDLDSTTAGYEELAGTTANEGKGWDPIGNWTDDYGPEGFWCIFNGQGYEIRDLFINRPDKIVVGLFGYLVEGGIIKNVGVANFTVAGYNVVGSLLANNMGGTVSNCYSTGNVTGHQYVGGLVGYNEIGHISNCCSTGSVAGSFAVGGLVGAQHPECTVTNSYSTCSVAEILDIGSGRVGGLVGDNYYVEDVIDSFWDTETSGQSTSAGGTGKNTTEMQNISTFSGAGWNIIAVNLNETNPAYTWNIIDNVTYPFLSWQS
jgi:hypothetical protein